MRSVAAILLLMLCWGVVSWRAGSYLAEKQFSSDLEEPQNNLKTTLVTVTGQVQKLFGILDALPALLAKDPKIGSAINEFRRIKSALGSTPDERRKSIRAGALSRFAWLNFILGAESRELTVDIIWLLDTDGDCLASSNANRADSFVGVNYADRLYFKSAIAGKRQQQYIVGRRTNIPGFNFSAPIVQDGRIIGVKVIKLDVDRLANWFKNYDFFITDAAGVVVLAQEVCR